MKTKIEDLTDEQLDHFCAIAQGWTKEYSDSSGCFYWVLDNVSLWVAEGTRQYCYHPTTNAVQCMAIQECEKIGVIYRIHALNWYAQDNNGGSHGYGETAKQAIIRCFVKSKLGKEVDCETI